MSRKYVPIKNNGKNGRGARLEESPCIYGKYCPEGNLGTDEKCQNYEKCERYIAGIEGKVIIEVIPFGPCRGSKKTLLEEEMGWKISELNPNPGF